MRLAALEEAAELSTPRPTVGPGAVRIVLLMQLRAPPTQSKVQSIDAVDVHGLLGHAEKPEYRHYRYNGDVVLVHFNPGRVGVGREGDAGEVAAVVELLKVIRYMEAYPEHDVAVEKEHLQGKERDQNDHGEKVEFTSHAPVTGVDAACVAGNTGCFFDLAKAEIGEHCSKG